MIACGNCGTPQADGTLVCGACGGFVYAAKMQSLQLEARSHEAVGRKAEARESWRAVLSLLPAEARQRGPVEEEIRRLDAALGLPPAQDPASRPIGPQSRGLLGGIGAAILFALSKAKLLLLGLGKFKTVLSMAIMAAVYTQRYGMWFAIGIVLLIYVHEMGHVLAIRARGMEADWPIFIPFVGAFVRLKSMPRDAAEDAYIGYAGPLFGSVAAAAVWAVAIATGNTTLGALAFFGFYLNFFNLIAIPPLDGGRVTGALDGLAWAAILPPLWLATWWNPDGMVVIVVITASARGLMTIFAWKRSAQASYARISSRARWSAAAAYAVLAIALITAMKITLPERLEWRHERSVQSAAVDQPIVISTQVR